MATCKQCGKNVSWWDINLKQKLCEDCIHENNRAKAKDMLMSISPEPVETLWAITDVMKMDKTKNRIQFGDSYITDRGIVFISCKKWTPNSIVDIYNAQSELNKIPLYVEQKDTNLEDLRKIKKKLFKWRENLFGSSIEDRVRFCIEDCNITVIGKTQIEKVDLVEIEGDSVTVLVNDYEGVEDSIIYSRILFKLNNEKVEELFIFPLDEIEKILGYLTDWTAGKELSQNHDLGANLKLPQVNIFINSLIEVKDSKKQDLINSLSNISTNEKYFMLFRLSIEKTDRDNIEILAKNIKTLSKEATKSLNLMIPVDIKDNRKAALTLGILSIICFAGLIAGFFSGETVEIVFFSGAAFIGLSVAQFYFWRFYNRFKNLSLFYKALVNM